MVVEMAGTRLQEGMGVLVRGVVPGACREQRRHMGRHRMEGRVGRPQFWAAVLHWERKIHGAWYMAFWGCMLAQRYCSAVSVAYCAYPSYGFWYKPFWPA